MTLETYHRYSIDQIYGEFGQGGEPEILCGGDFLVFPGAVVCCVVTGYAGARSGFTSAAELCWKPRRADYAPREEWPWLPEAARPRPGNHHLFVKTPAEVAWFYVGPAHLGRYGRDDDGLSAHFSWKMPIPREAWLAFGGSLEPGQPFAAIPVSEEARAGVRYHRAALDLLGIMPPLSQAAAERLTRFGRDHAISLPASLREWYGLAGALEITREISDIHRPVRFTDAGEDDLARLAQPGAPARLMLPIMLENQGVWEMCAALDDDGHDDPPVYLRFDEPGGIEWRLHAAHFSDCIFGWAWLWAGCWRDVILDVTQHMTPADRAYLRSGFEPRPVTFGAIGPYVCDRHERYADGDQRVTVLPQAAGPDIVWLAARTADSMRRMLARPWSFGANLLDGPGLDLEMQRMFIHWPRVV